MNAPDVAVHATRFQVTVLPLDDVNASNWSLIVEYRGHDRWAVLRGARMCLSRGGSWDYEVIPSEREDEWIAEHRFEYAEAIRLAIHHAPTVVVNGMTATEVLARINARKAVTCPAGTCGSWFSTDADNEREGASMSESIDIGRVAYEGYRAASDGKSLVSGEPLPTWGEQAPEIREAWRAAADAVLMFTESRGTQ